MFMQPTGNNLADPTGEYIACHHQENKHHPKRTAGINTPNIICGIGADDKGCQRRERKDGRGSTKGAVTYFSDGMREIKGCRSTK